MRTSRLTDAVLLTHWRKSKGKRAYDLQKRAMAEGYPLEAQTKID
jgi:hypothetical protein